MRRTLLRLTWCWLALALLLCAPSADAWEKVARRGEREILSELNWLEALDPAPLPTDPVAAINPPPPANAPLAKPQEVPRLRQLFKQPGIKRRLPGEFEPQHAMLVSCHKMVADEPRLFVDLIAALHPQMEVVAVVRNSLEYKLAQRLLHDRRLPLERVHFAEVPHDTMWARDYGPMIAQRYDGRPVLLDADYSSYARPDDDALPQRLARALKLKPLTVPLHIDGGNLLSNGQGLCVASHDLLHANLNEQQTEGDVRRLLREHYGAVQTVFLEPLVGEPTGHVDMFATFTSPNTIVVGAYDPARDADNAAILDRNARRLAAVRTAEGPLRVVRAPMPPNTDGVWRSYTNVIYANGALLVPSYPDLDAPGLARAQAIYAQLLPGWRIVTIDARSVSQLGGALHCVTMHLGVIRELPRFPIPSHIEADADPLIAGRVR